MIYLDNAATGWPKPYSVVCAVRDGLTSLAANPGRGAYKMSVDTAQRVYETRRRAAAFFNLSEPENIIFTHNCTAAINLALKCFLPAGSHAVVSDREHNAVMRPLHEMARRGEITFDVADIGDDVVNAAAHFARKINQRTRMLFCTHVSNVDGCVMPIADIGRLAARFGLLFAVDGAQSAGSVSIDMVSDGINLLCLPGHKGLCGPMGSGMLLVRDAQPCATLIQGGTGSDSVNPAQPDYLPDALESGTPAVPAVIGLGEGIKFVSELGAPNILRHERQLRGELAAQLSRLERVTVYEPQTPTGILLFNIRAMPCESVAAALDDSDIAVRAGLHCCPRRTGFWARGNAERSE